MAYQIVITEVANRQLRSLPVHDQRIIEQGIATKLTVQPTTITRSVKLLRPNAFAQFELRIGDYRVLYNVESQTVTIRLVGKKVGNRLIVEGTEFHGHQNNPPQPTDGASGSDTD